MEASEIILVWEGTNLVGVTSKRGLRNFVETQQVVESAVDIRPAMPGQSQESLGCSCDRPRRRFL
jgi:hypothetical protein